MSEVSTGIAGLDRLLSGGFPDKTAILLSGGPGTGKTLLGLNFLLAGASKGEKCCYFSLNETPEELVRACKNIKHLEKIEEYLDKSLVIKHLRMDEKVNLDFFTSIFESYPEIDRIVIDNVNKLFNYAESKKSYRQNFSDLISHLKKKVKCSLLLCETQGDNIDTGNGEAFECDGAITVSFMELEEKPKRILQIYKLRYTDFDARVAHEFAINKNGIAITQRKIV